MNKNRTKTKQDFFHVMKIVTGILLFAVVVLLSILGFRLGRQIFTDTPKTVYRTEHISYDLTVTKGESVLKVGRDLEEHGIIESGFAFFVQSKVYSCKIAPGTYTVSSRTSSKDILKYLNAEFLKTQQK